MSVSLVADGLGLGMDVGEGWCMFSHSAKIEFPVSSLHLSFMLDISNML